jgi:hypothetical protein
MILNVDLRELVPTLIFLVDKYTGINANTMVAAIKKSITTRQHNARGAA